MTGLRPTKDVLYQLSYVGDTWENITTRDIPTIL